MDDLFYWLSGYWDMLPNGMQDALLLLVYLLPTLLIGFVVVRGMRPLPLVRAMLWQFRWSNLVFVLLIAISVALGVGLIAQERGLRRGTAKAADKFELIVAAPGSEVTNVMATVYLQASDMPLLDGTIYNAVANHEQVDFAAPIAFGDSYHGAPVVGTTADFLDHLSGSLAEGKAFEGYFDAVAGADVPLAIGDAFTPAHGVGDGAEEGAHEGTHFTVTGRMQKTGSPWDKAILVPVEAVWVVHGLGTGHRDEEGEKIGPPFDATLFPGTPSILVHAKQLWANYALKSEFTTEKSMALFPGAVLSELHALLGDVREVMSVMAVITQILVAAGVLTGLVILTKLFSRRLALLRAIGAPRRFLFAIVWSFAASLIGFGALLGVVLGFAATQVISRIVSERTDILVEASLEWPEFHLVALFVSLTIVMAMIPAFLALRRPVVADLRG
ncbi:putative ABC transport system permease protein [Cohaesibacter sp. ES.047]|uniref:ABC transporter permease n=1 Tax=Cohaesibacter sp. ES.047 TaxID=1798205 RepID=UPI000BBFC508|nr:FtsX-like permease family protein [Cohaesibacter sp. ES.047]SNY91257.1 putative ABC transport system permease protein [Cohaesibacter sp. ES.047]